MKKIMEMEASVHDPSRWLIVIAILVSFGLRTYHLDADNFWNDEAGQALAALQPSATDTLAYVRNHAAAMPFDYLVTRIFAYITTNEFFLRFPAVFWSTTAVALLASLARMVAGTRVSAIATLFVAMAPQLVYYAQEMRPYAALLAFSLLSTYLLLRAFDRGSVRSWLLWSVTTVVGAYFHLYVLLTVCYGMAYLLWPVNGRGILVIREDRQRWFGFFASSALVILWVVPGYLYFAAQDQYRHAVFEFGGTFWSVTAAGLGWPLEHQLRHPVLLLALTAVGIVVVLRLNRQRNLMALLMGLPLIILVIFALDVTRGYWFLSRQLIHLQPIVLIFTSIGCYQIVALTTRHFPMSAVRESTATAVSTVALVSLVTIFGAPRLVESYAFDKGNGRQLITLLTTFSTARTTIYVVPGYETKIYDFYLRTLGRHSDLPVTLQAAVWPEILQPPTGADQQYLIAPPATLNAYESELRAGGYRPLFEAPDSGYLRSLWGRP